MDFVSPGYLEALGAQLRAGGDIGDLGDPHGHAGVVADDDPPHVVEIRNLAAWVAQ